jgi:cyclase
VPGDLSHVRELVADESLQLFLGQPRRQVNPPAQGDPDDAPHEEGAKPPGEGEADPGLCGIHGFVEIVSQDHVLESVAMHKTIIALMILATFSARAQQNFDNVQITTQKVAGSVYMLKGAGGNIGVTVGEDGIIIIDDQYAPLAPKIVDAIRAISDKPLRFVLNTHYHGDHTGGNEIIGKSATIVAHENVRKRLEAGLDTPQRKVPPAPKGALPVVTFDSTLTLHINGEDVRAVHFPSGHTDGDSVIWFTKSNVVHMGDDFFNGSFPFVDIDGGGSVRGLIKAVDKILGTLPDDVKIIPGHGDLADKAALRTYLQMLRETSAAAEAAIKAGKTLDQAKEEKLLSKWESWGKGFVNQDRFLGTLYREYGR